MKSNPILIRFILGTLLTSVLFGLCGCESDSTSQGRALKQFADDVMLQEVDICLGQNSTLLSFDGNNIWYQQFENNNALYYQYNIISGETKEIGRISNPILIGGDKAGSTDGIYLYAAVENNATIANVLFFLSYSKENMSPIASYTISELLIPIEYHENQIFSLKLDVQGETKMGISKLERLDIATGNTCVLIEEKADYGRKVGNALLNFDIENERIYVYSQTSEDVLCSEIKVFSMNGAQLEEYSLSNLPTKSLRETSTGVKVYKDIIYLISLSGEAVVGKMIDGGIQVLLQGVDIDYARDSQGDGFLLYQRNTSNIYVYDERNGSIDEVLIELPEGAKIRYILTHGNDVLLNTRSDDGSMKVYTTTFEKLGFT